MGRSIVATGIVAAAVEDCQHANNFNTPIAAWNRARQRPSAQHKIENSATSLTAGRLGKLSVRDSEIVLGTPLIMNRANIDTLDF